MDSRKQFEEWYEKKCDEGFISIESLAESAWQAGRASMRDEAAEMVSYNVERDMVKAIKP